jgi:uncharacterized protein (TIGR03118 family)
VKHKIAYCLTSLLLFEILFAAADASAQTIGYRQTNLASNLPNVANNVTPGLVDPWGIAFLSGQPFFIADNQPGHVTAHDFNGLGVGPGGFIIPNGAGTGFDHPTGIVADQNSLFGGLSLVQPFLLATDEGTIFTWGLDAQGDIPQAATLRVDHSSFGAVYKGAAILTSSLTAPAFAVTDFHGGFIETFLPGFSRVALPGSFTDPNLPEGYAPFGIQVIGRQVFVTYGLQDAIKHDPVPGAGNGIVSIFDMDGNFVRRFATAGALNVPWGVTQASASFGPFSNDILIGNLGDGNINAFDPATGNFIGKLKDGDGRAIARIGLHGLAFRPDGFGDPNTLYFTAQFQNADDGLFGAITTGLVSLTQVSAPDTPVNASATITAKVAGALDNPGTPTGTVTFLDGANALGTAPLVDGSATLDAIFAKSGIHEITAQYGGDSAFLASSNSVPVHVAGFVTTATLLVPANATPGASVTLTATISSSGGIPTGQVVFLDGNTNLGVSALDDAGVAFLRINTLAAGMHTLTASYAGDTKFDGSVSAGVTINIASADFSFGATPTTATVIAGDSTQFMLTVTPVGGFANNVTFSCSPVTGISCTFSPATVNSANGTASTTLTVTTSTSVTRYGFLMPAVIGPCALIIALSLLVLAMLCGGKLRIARASTLTVTASLAIVALVLAMGGCGGYGGSSQPNRGTASILVIAQSGSVAHTTTVTVTVQ